MFQVSPFLVIFGPATGVIGSAEALENNFNGFPEVIKKKIYCTTTNNHFIFIEGSLLT